MAAAANLIFAIATLLGVSIIAVALGIAVFKPHLLKRIRVKVKDFEGEIEPAQTAEHELAESSAGVPAELSDAANRDEAPQPAQEEAHPSSFQLLIVDKKYHEGLVALKSERVKEEDPEAAVRSEAIYHWRALQQGFEQAFGGLKKLSEANPTSFDAQYWFSVALERAGLVEQGMQLIEVALSLASSSTDRLLAANFRARMQVDLGTAPLDAARTLFQQLDPAPEPSDRNRAFEAIAGLFANAKEPDQESQFLMLVAATTADPSNKDSCLAWRTRFPSKRPTNLPCSTTALCSAWIPTFR